MNMPAWICATCGNHYPSPSAPRVLRHVADERQWVPPSGHGGPPTTSWRARAAPAGSAASSGRRAGSDRDRADPAGGHRAAGPADPHARRATCCGIRPASWTTRPSSGSRQRGGLRAVTASHPHFYGAMVEWSQRLRCRDPGAEADAQLAHRARPGRPTWSGRLEVLPGVTLVQCGGHFPGSAVVHWAQAAQGQAACWPATRSSSPPARTG